MATVAQWIEGARPRTLPNAIAPVIAGTGAGLYVGGVTWWKAALALVVSLALIVGVNYANDYSDGIRGTDDDRVGPLRLVGSGAARPGAVKAAAFTALGVGAAAGLALAIATAWWLVLIGAVCILGAWFYTGGRRPYGYLGFGEIAVFVFFGLVAVLGTQFVTSGKVDWVGVGCAVAVGALSSGVLIANNLRDIPTDTESGKVTLAVRLGDAATRRLYLVMCAVPVVVSIVLAVFVPAAAAGLLVAIPLVKPLKLVMGGAQGRELIPVLALTGVAMLVWSLATGIALGLS
ncbi:1,4-dihydroxy-2-naphthoate polyprenyltransferase [Gordonia sp. (in: high G+C Gram-positive bacteria)]|uniref:1,4-dihydroxy-2-naphthoate polyprenyltransferase n=1 Tax=Gordonia sp. (in: high G+C Gram-positive bacteria) TaxID=84139 RepID=UPI00169CC24B|nr:1,4-dihydroxy-2-naphthoate polyprenyltransferase [Gordonia sp. (in: high G+C Gram-positive bacteria)]NLG45522.1 1,4-dihydroxy-2-naphthoate polyprenyltransferase [Gordonia sp. (in: high G+C Gram-positive bacteria)]